MAAAAEEIEMLRIEITAARLSARFYEDHAKSYARKLDEWMVKFMHSRREYQELLDLMSGLVESIESNDRIVFCSDASCRKRDEPFKFEMALGGSSKNVDHIIKRAQAISGLVGQRISTEPLDAPSS